MDFRGWKDFGEKIIFSLRPNWALKGQISLILKISKPVKTG